jgi:hypothetical protein
VSPKCKSFLLKLILDNNKEKKKNKPLKFQPKKTDKPVENNNTLGQATIKKTNTFSTVTFQ